MSQPLFGPALEAELAYHRELVDASYHRRSLWRRLRDRSPARRPRRPVRHGRSPHPHLTQRA